MWNAVVLRQDNKSLIRSLGAWDGRLADLPGGINRWGKAKSLPYTYRGADDVDYLIIEQVTDRADKGPGQIHQSQPARFVPGEDRTDGRDVWLVEFAAVDRDLPQIAAAKKEAAKKHRIAAESRTMDIEINGTTYPVQIDQGSQAKIQGAIQMMDKAIDLGLATPASLSQVWRLGDNQTIEISYADYIQLGLKVGAEINRLYALHGALDTQIQAALDNDDRDALLAIDEKEGWDNDAIDA